MALYRKYSVEVTASVRLEPALLSTRRGAFQAFRHIDLVLRGEGYFPDSGGDDAVVTLSATRNDGTQRVKIVRRYRARGSERRGEHGLQKYPRELR